MDKKLLILVVLTMVVGLVSIGGGMVEPAQAHYFAYITNTASASVSVVDIVTGTVTATIAVGDQPYGVAVHPDGSTVYVTTELGFDVSVIDTASNTVTATVEVGMWSTGLAVHPDGTRVYVVNQSLLVIDTASNTVTATVRVGNGSTGVAVHPDGTRVYVTNRSDNTVSVIDTASNTVTATVRVGLRPNGVAVNPDGTHAYVTNFDSDDVSIIDTATNTVTSTIAVGDFPWGVAVHPDGSRAYVSNSSETTVSVIDTASKTVTATVEVGPNPLGLAVSPDGTRLCVAIHDEHRVSIINTTSNTVTGTVTVGGSPVAFGQFIAPSATTYPIGPATCWIGLKNSDDQGTQFDLRNELFLNDTLVWEGQTLCITGVTRNPSYARNVTVRLSPVSTGTYDTGDTLSLKVFTRIGTNPDASKCSGPGGSHNNAVGLRLYYDTANRASGFGAEISHDPMKDFFLHSTGTNYFLNDVTPTGAIKYKDSSSVNFNNGNPWKEIGTWDMTLP
jgi:YVTN family beta-propeller protein